jgi:hypothetical protein
MIKNSMCDGAKCQTSSGPVKALPYGVDSRAILCYHCFQHEIEHRINLNKDRVADKFAVPLWTETPEYKGA